MGFTFCAVSSFSSVFMEADAAELHESNEVDVASKHPRVPDTPAVISVRLYGLYMSDGVPLTDVTERLPVHHPCEFAAMAGGITYAVSPQAHCSDRPWV